jgi:cyclase
MKIRIIPSILTNGTTVVKGEQFDNWRTVGNVQAIAKLFAARNVDELLFLNIGGGSSRKLSDDLIAHFSESLNIPFAVGGGITSVFDAENFLRLGAEKIVIGSAAITNPQLISDIAHRFGSQAVVVSLDVLDANNNKIVTNSGKQVHDINPIDFAHQAAAAGAGELLVQTVSMDGKMNGMNYRLFESLVNSLDIPIIASSGAGNVTHIVTVVETGVSAVAVGALFQFTEETPSSIREALQSYNKPVRII